MEPLQRILRYGVVAAARLREQLGVSPATLSRLVAAEPRVVRVGHGRASRYGWREHRLGLPADELPAYRVSEHGDVDAVGRLIILDGDQIAWLPDGDVYDGLPPEVDDMRPTGFLGRSFVTANDDLGLPHALTLWSNDHILTAVSRRGEDLPGNLIIGDESLERYRRSPTVEIDEADLRTVARDARAGRVGASSAGGEQPKFACVLDGAHRLVKFVERTNEVSERWADLLLLEHHALSTLREAGVPAATTRIVDDGAWRFLVVERFDRVGLHGRRPVLSLFNALQMPGISWSRCAAELQRQRMLAAGDARTLRLFDAFGRHIQNTDRHHYNVLLFPTFASGGNAVRGYRIAPAYDQLPMRFAPGGAGHVPELRYHEPTRTQDVWDVWDDARELAQRMWSTAAEDPGLTASMRRLAARSV